MVVGGGEEVPVQVGVPAQPVALLLVAAQAQVGVALKKGQVCCCCTADSQTDGGIHQLYRAGLSVGRKVLKTMFWEVPPADWLIL